VVGIRRENGTWSSVHNDTSNIANAPVIASRLSVDRISLPADPMASRSAILVITARRTAEYFFSEKNNSAVRRYTAQALDRLDPDM
jgi:hypothetical protein